MARKSADGLGWMALLGLGATVMSVDALTKKEARLAQCTRDLHAREADLRTARSVAENERALRTQAEARAATFSVALTKANLERAQAETSVRAAEAKAQTLEATIAKLEAKLAAAEKKASV